MKTFLELLYAGKEQCEPGHAFGPAVRPHYLLHFILEGRGKYQTAQGTFHLRKGQAFLIKPGEITYYPAERREPWRYCWIGIGGSSAQEIIESCDFGSEGYIYEGTQENEIEKFAERIVDLFQDYEQNELEILGDLYHLFARFRKKEKSAQTNTEQQYLEKAYEYIRNNYSYPVKISGIARYIGIDRSYLYKLMMEELQMAPQQYLIEYRLNRAKEMLKNDQMTVTEIAYSCGFKDAPSFCRHFKKRNGITPKQYRKNGNKSSV